MSKIVLVTGGARSGKSRLAERMAAEIAAVDGGQVGYVATGEPLDDEFRARIEAHRGRRKEQFKTYEEPLAIADLLGEIGDRHRVVIVECLTTWLGNVFHHVAADERDDFVERHLDGMLGAFGKGPTRESTRISATRVRERLLTAQNLHFLSTVEELFISRAEHRVLILVANELGFGLVPTDEVSRAYRDAHGWMNQRLAAAANYVYLVVAGVPTRIA
jgi:adenosylcobinamide kinase/adenosylcobinamide-phosphate guanylyltransferase